MQNMQFQQETRASIQSLTNQMGQLATQLNEQQSHITFSICPESQKCECHYIEVGKAVSRTSTSNIFFIRK